MIHCPCISQIEDIPSLRPLAALPCLVRLRLVGNPVARLPHYRAAVVYSLPKLEYLDDTSVTVSEREAAPSVLARVSRWMDTLLHQEARVDQMGSIANLLFLHVELRRAQLSGVVPLLLPRRSSLPTEPQRPDPDRIASYWPYLDILGGACDAPSAKERWRRKDRQLRTFSPTQIQASVEYAAI